MRTGFKPYAEQTYPIKEVFLSLFIAFSVAFIVALLLHTLSLLVPFASPLLLGLLPSFEPMLLREALRML